MREYKFQYYKTRKFLFFSLAHIGTIIFLSIGSVHLKIGVLLLIPIAIIAQFLLYRFLKNYYYGHCIAKINDTQIEFKLEDAIRIIQFSDLISYQIYQGNRGSTRLQLKNSVKNFSITVSDSRDFESFCNELTKKLDNYKTLHNPKLIHVIFSFATKSWLYFLIFVSIVYLIAFIFETKILRLAIGIAGALFLLRMWLYYFADKKKQTSSNGS